MEQVQQPPSRHFIPDHITNDGRESESIPHRRLTGAGLFSNQWVRSIQDAMYARLHHPTSIIEFPPVPPGVSPGQIETVATDSNLIDEQLLPSCRLFNRRASEQPCLDCNNAVALVFRGLTRAEFADRAPARIKESLLLARCQRYLDHHIDVIDDRQRGRFYLAYDCPLLGYWELAFPVLFKDQVIAVFMLGQICRAAKLDRIRRIQDAFFTDPASPHQGHDPERLWQEIRQEHDKLVLEPGRVLNDDDYQELLDRAVKELEEMEARIRERVEVLLGPPA